VSFLNKLFLIDPLNLPSPNFLAYSESVDILYSISASALAAIGSVPNVGFFCAADSITSFYLSLSPNSFAKTIFKASS
jgi:hypothetical protein